MTIPSIKKSENAPFSDDNTRPEHDLPQVHPAQISTHPSESITRSQKPFLPSDYFGQNDNTIQLRPGLELVLGDFCLTEPCSFPFETSGDACEFAFVLSGTISSQHPCIQGEKALAPHQYGFWMTPKMKGCHTCYPGEHILFACVRIQRRLMAEVIQKDLDKLPKSVRLLLQNEEEGFYHHSSSMSTPMLSAAQQIFQCPYEGTMRKLLWESKALELTSHTMADIFFHETHVHSPVGRKQDSQIHHACHILLENMASPPSLSKLAKAAGISESGLTRGFRRIFGVSAFEFLRNQRLEKARTLLESEDMNVTEVAYAVGLSSPGHLTRLFSKQFKMNPGEYRRKYQKLT